MKDMLKDAFGLTVKEELIGKVRGLPMYMTNGRSFYRMEISGIPFLLVSVPEDDKFGVVALQKQLIKYSEIVGMNVAFAFSKLTRTQRDALISRTIPFVSLPDQLYLPFLGIALQNRFRKEKILEMEKMKPAAQCLFLYFLYMVKDGQVIKKQAAEALRLTGTSITRASEQLTAMGLITEETIGKERLMRAAKTGSEFLAQAKPYLINPVFRRIKVKACQELEALPVAGETALSLRTMLNTPPIQKVAMLKSDPIVKTLETVDERWEAGDTLVEAELWKYDPFLFAKDRLVDPVSMMLSLQELQDERVQGELEEYMEAIQW